MKRKLPASGEPAKGREPAGDGAPKSVGPKDLAPRPKGLAPRKDAAPKKDVALKSVASKGVGAKSADIIAPEIIESARRALESDRIKPAVKCSVCGADATPNAAEQLCWVCRRLKISAWRDVEQQMPAQE